MPASPKVFISATTGDLRTIRQLVKDALLTRDCHPVEQTNFPPDSRTVAAMLRGRIGECQALIHIAGLRYGAEPDPATLPPGAPRRSYTQMEYDIGRELQAKRGPKRFRVYTFICPESFPYDTPADPATPPESEDKQLLQQAHRATLLGAPHLYELVHNPEQLQSRLHALQEDLHHLRSQQTRTTRLTLAVATAILLALVGIGYGLLHLKGDTGDLKAATAGITDQGDKNRALLEQIIEQTRQPAAIGSSETPQQRYDRALAEVAFKHKLQPAVLRAKIDDWVARVKEDPEASTQDLALAEYKEGRFDTAAAKAATAYDEAMAQREKNTLVARKAARLEGDAHRALAHFDQALSAYRKAAAFTDRKQDPVGWAEEHYRVALILDDQAQYIEAEELLRAIVEIREKHLSTDNPALVAALNHLAKLLHTTNRLTEAEMLVRRALAIDEASFSKDHPYVARDINNLAQLLQATNRLMEAEPLMRRALEIDEASFGEDHPEVATDLNNLALLLQATNRLAEAEPLMRRVLAIHEASFGRNHPRVAAALNNLAQLLQATNCLAEAEPLMRRALEIDEASFGSVHPDVARDLNNLARLFQETNRITEAESPLRRALGIDEASYGKDHPKVAIRLNNLALILKDTNRLTEAEPLAARTVRILLKFRAVTSHSHPHTMIVVRNYVTICRDLKLSDSEIRSRLDTLRRESGLDQAAFDSLWQELSALPSAQPISSISPSPKPSPVAKAKPPRPSATPSN